MMQECAGFEVFNTDNTAGGRKAMAMYFTVRRGAWAMGLICCLLGSAAMADDEEGVYIGISAGPSVLHNACQSPWIPYLASVGGTSACSERSFAYRATFGYQYTPMWGLEVSYGTLGYASSTGTANLPTPFAAGTVPTNYSWQVKGNALAIQAVATLHMGDTLSVFGKFGVARVEYDEYMSGWNAAIAPPFTGIYYTPVVNEKRNSPALGGGVRFDVSPHGSILLAVDTFGSHDIYNYYGQTTKVRPVTASFGLMYRY